MIKTTHPYVGTQSNSKKVCLFQFYFSNNITGHLVKYLFMLHMTPLSFIDRNTRNWKLRMRENHKGHRFLHFLIMTRTLIMGKIVSPFFSVIFLLENYSKYSYDFTPSSTLIVLDIRDKSGEVTAFTH